VAIITPLKYVSLESTLKVTDDSAVQNSDLLKYIGRAALAVSC